MSSRDSYRPSAARAREREGSRASGHPWPVQPAHGLGVGLLSRSSITLCGHGLIRVVTVDPATGDSEGVKTGLLLDGTSSTRYGVAGMMEGDGGGVETLVTDGTCSTSRGVPGMMGGESAGGETAVMAGVPGHQPPPGS
jgi:hypothetical protein